MRMSAATAERVALLLASFPDATVVDELAASGDTAQECRPEPDNTARVEQLGLFDTDDRRNNVG